MKDLRARWVFTVVKSGWGQIRFWLPFAVFLTCTIAPDRYRVISLDAHSPFVTITLKLPLALLRYIFINGQ